MKKYLAILCTAALLCGCSNNGKSSSTAGNTAPDQETNAAVQETTAYDPYFDTSYEYPITGTDTDMSDVENVDWSLIYRDAIEDFKKSENFDETARFTVYDINEDRTRTTAMPCSRPVLKATGICNASSATSSR